MNARLRIIVQVIGADAAKLRALQGAVGGIGAAGTAAGLGISRMASSMHRAVQMGKNLQWTGRQLEFRFTLPLILAGVAATKFALDNERAITRVRKVYGDLSMTQAKVKKDVKDLSEAFRALSDRFGVTQSKVIDIGATWAQAGATGIALARATKLTMEAMILGSLDAETAATALITVMLQYGLTTKELRMELANFNAVENQTAVAFGDLIQVVQKSGAVAREAGIDLRHLAAMAAAIVPAAANAEEAGTSLKMLIQRLYSPTVRAADRMNALGLDIDGAAWRSMTGEKRFIALGKSIEGLTQPEKMAAMRDIFEFRQVNRAIRLMDDMVASTEKGTKSQSQYGKALDATKDKTKVLSLYTRELGIFLGSHPQKFQILLAQMQNMAAEILNPLLPSLIGLIAKVKDVIKWFTGLDPAIQQLVLGLLLFVAVFGPLLSYLGAFITLLASMGSGLVTALGVLGGFIAPWALIAAAIVGVIALVVIFRDEIAAGLSSAWHVVVGFARDFVDAFNNLPSSIASAFGDVVSVIMDAMMAVRDATVSGLNAIWDWIAGFATGIARTVINGLSALPRGIVAVFQTVVKIIKKAVMIAYEWLSYLNPFARHSPSLVESVARGVEYIAAKYATLANIGQSFRQALADFKAFQSATESARTGQRQASYAEQRTEIASVDPGSLSAFDQMVTSLNRLYNDLRRVGVEFDHQAEIVAEWESQLRSAEDALTGLDQSIFENEQAANAVRLAILQWEDANGTIDDLQSRIADLQGELEGLRGQRVDLIRAGAGSNVLAPIDSEIARLEELQRSLVGSGGNEIDQLKQQLEELERHGQIMSLQRELALDPIQHALDLEQEKLNDLAAAYDGIEGLIRDMESAMNDFSSAAQRANQQTSSQASKAASKSAAAAQKSLKDAGIGAGAGEDLGAGMLPGDFERPGGTGPQLNTKGEKGSIDKFTKKMEKEAEKALGKLDLFKPFKKMWHDFEDWLGNTVWPTMGQWAREFNQFWADLFNSIVSWIAGIPQRATQAMEDAFSAVGDVLSWAWETLWNGLLSAMEPIWAAIELVVTEALGFIGEIIGQALDGIKQIWDIGWGLMIAVVTFIWETIQTVVTTAIEVVRTIIETALNTISTVWNTIWTTMKNIVIPIWEGIKGAVSTAINAVSTVVSTVLGTIKNTWSTIWNGIKSVADNIWGGLKKGFGETMGAIGNIIEGAKKVFAAAWNGIKAVFAAPINFVAEQIINRFIDVINTVASAVGAGKPIHRLPNPLVSTGGGTGNIGASVPFFKIGGIAGEGRQFKDLRDPLAGDERVAVLHTGEGILPRGAMRRLGRSRFEMLRSGRVPAFANGGVLGGAFGQDESKLTPKGMAIEQMMNELPVPAFQFGGILDDVTGAIGSAFTSGVNAVKSIAGFVETVAREVAAQAAITALNAASALLSGMPFGNTPQGKWLRGGVEKLKDVIVGYIRGTDEEAKKHGGSTALLKALGTMLGVPYSTSGRFGPNFYDCSGFIHAGMMKAGINDSGASGYTSLSYENWTTRTGGRLSVAEARNTPGVLLYHGHRTGPGGHIGASRGDGTVYETPSSAGHKSGISPFGRSGWDAAGRIPAAALGAFIRGGRGGTLLNVGEGLRNELVMPLPKGVNPSNLTKDGKKEIHFHGDLSFPNISSGKDAEAFIRNLEALVD